MQSWPPCITFSSDLGPVPSLCASSRHFSQLRGAEETLATEEPFSEAATAEAASGPSDV